MGLALRWRASQRQVVGMGSDTTRSRCCVPGDVVRCPTVRGQRLRQQTSRQTPVLTDWKWPFVQVQLRTRSVLAGSSHSSEVSLKYPESSKLTPPLPPCKFGRLFSIELVF